MHDSFTPLGGLVPLFDVETGEVIFGGVGTGLYGTLIFVVLTLFIAGLMVWRTPEYLGKKNEAYDVKLVMLVLMVLAATILGALGARLGLTTQARMALTKSSMPLARRSATTVQPSLDSRLIPPMVTRTGVPPLVSRCSLASF
jgi:K+-transporting ATPase A subunit